MTTFLLDLWQDLRAKRLWPIAVALVAATVAVPVLLFKPATSAPPSSAAGQASNAAKLPTVTLDASSVDSSHLDVFKSKNPFAAATDKAPVIAPAGNGTTTGTSSGVGSSLASAASAAGGSTVSGTSTSGTSSSSGGSTTAPAGPDGKPVSPGLHYFTYTVDVKFGLRFHLKTYKSVGELDVLPDGKAPVIAFMGIKDAKTAMFFIAYPALQATGEGTCQPKPQNCMFVYLKTDEAHNEETLSTQNGQVSYRLKLTGMHIKTLSKSQAVGSTTPEKAGTAKSKRQRAAALAAKVHDTLLAMPALSAKR